MENCLSCVECDLERAGRVAAREARRGEGEPVQPAVLCPGKGVHVAGGYRGLGPHQAFPLRLDFRSLCPPPFPNPLPASEGSSLSARSLPKFCGSDSTLPEVLRLLLGTT